MHDVTPSTAQESVTPQVDMKLAGTRVHLTLTVPMAPVPPGAILPVLQTLSEAVGANVASELETQGKRISCRAGCGACCRQLVPITEIEARYLGELVESLAQERQTEIRRRFADVLRRLNKADLLETLRHLERFIPEKREARCQEIVRDAAGFLRWIVVGEESPFFAARHCVLCYDHVQADVRMTSVERGGGEGC